MHAVECRWQTCANLISVKHECLWIFAFCAYSKWSHTIWEMPTKPLSRMLLPASAKITLVHYTRLRQMHAALIHRAAGRRTPKNTPFPIEKEQQTNGQYALNLCRKPNWKYILKQQQQQNLNGATESLSMAPIETAALHRTAQPKHDCNFAQKEQL